MCLLSKIVVWLSCLNTILRVLERYPYADVMALPMVICRYASRCRCHYSLIETAKPHGLEPYAYLNAVFKALPYTDTIEKIDAF